MLRRALLAAIAVALFLLPMTASAQIVNPPYWPPDPSDVGPAHPVIDPFNVLIANYNAGILTLKDMRQMGLSVFATPFNTYDGHGDGPFLGETPTRAFGHRPTLQGNGLILRVNGLDAQSCNECHTIVSNRTRLPTLGFGGVGGMVQNAIIMSSLIDLADSFDNRVSYFPYHDPDLPLEFDGVADYNGRFANPPFLFGGGGTELLGKEMTQDLQYLLGVAQGTAPGIPVYLDTHGVNFGYLVKNNDGTINYEHVEGVDEDLVVKPFGRKGENFTMRDFDRGAMQFHFGIQPVEVLQAQPVYIPDEDQDGVEDEVTVGEMTVLHFFDVTNPPPYKEPGLPSRDGLDTLEKGFGIFKQVGCDYCHKPSLVTRGREVPLAHPEVANDPDANVYAKIDLVGVGFKAIGGAGVEVPFFSDLKRHDMGDRLAETFEFGEISNREFITARLWGIADTAPYLHDGRATTLYQAIWYHGGEAGFARNNFLALNDNQQNQLLRYLRSLRTPIKPNEDLLPLP